MVRTEKQNNNANNGLPIVTSKTVDAILHVYSGKSWGKHLNVFRDRLIQENPQLVKFIESQISKYPRSLHIAMFEVVIGTLSILEHQSLVDKKNSKLSTDKSSL